MGLRDIKYNSYTYPSEDIIEYSRINTDIKMFEQKERTKIKQATYFKISEIGNDDNFIKIDKHNINSFHADVKDKIFVFSGDINLGDETIKLSRLSKESRTKTPFFKNVEISIASMDRDNINVNKFNFIGYVANYYEIFDNKGNGRFELVITHRENFYNENLIITRKNELLAIAKFPNKKEKLLIPLSKEEAKREVQKGFQTENLLFSSAGIICAGIGITAGATALVAGGLTMVATIGIGVTILYCANTIFSGIQSLRLDYIGDDEELVKDDWKVNPIKWSFGELISYTIGEDKRAIGHAGYYLSEIVVGGIGLRDTAKSLRVASNFKHVKISGYHPVLGKMAGSTKKIKKGRAIYNGFQLTTGGYNLKIQAEGFKENKEKIAN
ncbi:hypothetical protein [Fusobacterium varium]|uniref:hypothetical protein n=1 Tax=Fusobacterium varium TaxID=856 RepID=UPI00266CD7F9|nr:hypothetical protein [Fusobacterium varium]